MVVKNVILVHIKQTTVYNFASDKCRCYNNAFFQSRFSMRKTVGLVGLFCMVISMQAKTLVAYYSYTSNIQRIVEALVSQIEADVVRIEPAEKGVDYAADNYAVGSAQIAALLTQAAFYAGWPNAWAGFRIAKEVWADAADAATEKERFQQQMIFPVGEPNSAYARYFTGNSYLARISDSQIPFSNVTFEPGCRNNWHIHRSSKGGGQMLVGVAGRGWYQEEGKPAVEILPGTVVHIPANVKHWHGAAADSWFAHLAFEIPGENASNEWLEPVSDEEYGRVR